MNRYLKHLFGHFKSLKINLPNIYIYNKYKFKRWLNGQKNHIFYFKLINPNEDLSVACILWFPRVGNLNLTAPLTPRWCFISWQEVTDLAPGRHRAAGQRISVCSQGGSNYGHSDVWFLCCQKLIALLCLCCTTWSLMRSCCKTLYWSVSLAGEQPSCVDCLISFNNL